MSNGDLVDKVYGIKLANAARDSANEAKSTKDEVKGIKDELKGIKIELQNLNKSCKFLVQELERLRKGRTV